MVKQMPIYINLCLLISKFFFPCFELKKKRKFLDIRRILGLYKNQGVKEFWHRIIPSSDIEDYRILQYDWLRGTPGKI